MEDVYLISFKQHIFVWSLLQMNEETTDSMKTYNNLMAAPLLRAFLPELLWRTMVTIDTLRISISFAME